MKKYISISLLLMSFLLLLSGCTKQNAKEKIHKLNLSSHPADAVAHVAGKTFNLPHEFKMSPGSYLFRIERPGYAAAWFSCRVNASGITVPRTTADGSVRWEKLSPAAKQIKLQEQGGTVLIQSNPDTAKVVRDGKSLGVTPLVLTDLPFGKHEVQLQSPNYADVTVSWEIRNHSPIIVRTDLQSNIGQLSVTSTPSRARLFIGEKFVGVTPYRGTCSVGNHAIRLMKDGYISHEGYLSITKGQLTEKEIVLEVSPCNFNIHSIPAGAQVFLNGRLKGTTPLALKDLPAGKYKITLNLDGCDETEDTVELAPGSSLRKDYILASSQGGLELNVYPAGVKVFLNGREIGVVREGETPTQTQLMRVDKLAPGTYIVKAVHKRADPEIRKIRIGKGQIVRPKRIELWVPNAEITWKDNGKTEQGMIYGDSEKIILFGPSKGIRYEIDKSLLKSIKFLDINE